MRRILILRFAFAATCLLIARSSVAADWTAINADAQNTSRSESTLQPTSLTRTWSSSEPFHDPLIIGTQVIAAKYTSIVGSTIKLTSFDLATGQKTWEDSWVYGNQFAGATAFAYGGGLIALTSNTVVNSTVYGNLRVFDAATGVEKYTVSLPNVNSGNVMISTDLPGAPVAYVTGGSGYTTAVSLGANSGTVLWENQSSSNAGNIAVAGNLLISVGSTQYYAMDRSNGTINHFHQGNLTGGGVTTPVVDEQRQQFYILGQYTSSQPKTLSAYSYANNQITLLWQKTGLGLNSRNSVTLGPTGKIYSAEGSTLLEIDPTTGTTLRSISNGIFANGATSIVSDGYLWEFGKGPIVSIDTYVYDLDDLSLVKHLAGDIGNSGTTYVGQSALSNNYFVFDYSRITDQPGLVVYQGVPEPSAATFLLAGCLLLRRRSRAT